MSVEMDALDASLDSMTRRVQSGEGGGIALRRMHERRRRLERRLADVDAEKGNVKLAVE